MSTLGDGQVSEAYASGANDVVVVRQPNGELAGTPVNLQIGEKNDAQVLISIGTSFLTINRGVLSSSMEIKSSLS